MPYPKKVEAAYSSTLSLEISPQVSYTLSENCIGNCKDFIDKNFKHSITKPLERQKGKKDFKISSISIISNINSGKSYNFIGTYTYPIRSFNEIKKLY